MFRSVNDGLGHAKVYIDGIETPFVKWADSTKGLVCVVHHPIEIVNEEVVTDILTGEVEIRSV